MCVHVLSYACVQAHPCHSDAVEVRKEVRCGSLPSTLLKARPFFLFSCLAGPELREILLCATPVISETAGIYYMVGFS